MTEPRDHDAEVAVLGALLLDGGALTAVRDVLEPGDFFEDRHAAIYRAASVLGDRGEPIELLTLRRQIEAAGMAVASDYLADLAVACPSPSSARHYAGRVAALATRRRMVAAARVIGEQAVDEGLGVEEMVSQAEAAVLGVLRGGERNATHVAEVAAAVWAGIERDLGRRQYVSGVGTGFSEIDRVTSGWQPGDLIVLGARPSVGKTAMGLAWAHAAASTGRPTWFLSLEMAKEAIVQRLICMLAMVDGWLLRTGRADAMVFQRVARAMERIGSLPLWIDDSSSVSPTVLRHRVRRWVSEKRCELLVIDYLGLMAYSREDARLSTADRVGNVAAAVKGIAKELRIPVILLAQLSRESERRGKDHTPMLSDLRDSGKIEEHADVVMLLHRPGMHDPEVDRSLTKLIVAKNRNGPIGEIELVFTAEQTAFRESNRGRGEPAA